MTISKKKNAAGSAKKPVGDRRRGDVPAHHNALVTKELTDAIATAYGPAVERGEMLDKIVVCNKTSLGLAGMDGAFGALTDRQVEQLGIKLPRARPGELRFIVMADKYYEIGRLEVFRVDAQVEREHVAKSRHDPRRSGRRASR
jgi:hypothetical protein